MGFEDDLTLKKQEEIRPASDGISIGAIVNGAYKVTRELGRGGMGAVYEVEQVFLHQSYALKTLNDVYSDAVMRRFQREAVATSALNHPNIVRTHNFGLLENGKPFFIMDLATGETLRSHLQKCGKLSPKEAVEMFSTLCEALAYAHEKGVVHRDLKPSNIILQRDGEAIHPKIFDFGIARLTDNNGVGNADLTKTGEVMGTPFYMSPEQCMGGKIDKRSDIYSLACVLFEALTGAPPFCGETALSTLMMHQNQMPPTLKDASLGDKFPMALEAAVAKALAKDPGLRFQDCRQFRDALNDSFNVHDVGSATSAGATGSKNTIFVIGAIILGVIVVAYSAFMPPVRNEAPPPVVAPVEPVDSTSDLLKTPTAIEKADEATKPTLLLNASYSTIKDGMRIFNFGESNIGDLLLELPVDGKVPRLRHATGEISVPITTKLTFKGEYRNIAKDGSVLRRFKKDDLYGLILQDKQAMSVFDANADDNVFDDSLVFASHLSKLRVIRLGAAPITALGLTNMRIESFPELDILDISKTDIDGKDLAHFSIIRRVKVLTLMAMKNVAPVIAALAGSTKLESLRLQGPEVTVGVLKNIAKCPNIKILGIMDAEHFNDNAVQYLLPLKNLEELNVGISYLTPAAAKSLRRFRSLKSLHGDFRSLDEAQIEELRRAIAPIVLDAKRRHMRETAF